MDMDYEDCFHIIYQDKQGNIFYSKMGNDSISTVPVLNSKQASSYNKHLFLVHSKNAMHFFYTLQHNNSTMLAHQILANGQAEVPKIIDYVMDNTCPYTVICDKSGSIYAFYQSSDGRYIQLGYKRYLQPQKLWGEFVPITKLKGIAEYPRAVVDSKGTIHLCYQCRFEKYNNLIYQQKVPDRNMWTNEFTVHSSSHSFADFSVVCTGSDITVYWVRDDIIYCSSSGDYGITWSKPARYPFSAGRQMVCVYYKTNSPYEADRIISSCVPGSFINGFRLAFYKTSEDAGGKSMSAEELRKMIVESLQMLKTSVEELKEADTALKGNITDLYSAQQNINREITKCNVRLSNMENEIGRAMAAYKNFDYNQLKERFVSELDLKSLFHQYEMELQEIKREISDLKEEMAQKKS
jgi:hypothetical protein